MGAKSLFQLVCKLGGRLHNPNRNAKPLNRGPAKREPPSPNDNLALEPITALNLPFWLILDSKYGDFLPSIEPLAYVPYPGPRAGNQRRRNHELDAFRSKSA